MHSPEATPSTAGFASLSAQADVAARPLNAAFSVHLADVQHVLSLFTQGLSGRYLNLRPVAARGPRGEAVSTDGTAIYLPEVVAQFADPRHNLGVYRIAVLHQLGFYENGSFTFSLEQARRRIPSLAQTASAPAPHKKASDLERFFALSAVPVLTRRLFMILEDLRIDAAMRRRYPGARADLERVLAQALTERPRIDTHESGAFFALLDALMRYSLGARREGLLAEHEGEDTAPLLASLLDAAARMEAEGATVYDTARAALACYAALEQAGLPRKLDDDMPESNDDVAPDGEEAEKPESMAFDEDALLGTGAVDFRGELNAEFVDDEMIGGNIGTLEGDTGPSDSANLSLEEALKQRRVGPGGWHSPAPADDGPPKEARTFLYDEWDFHHQTYIKGWCRLYEHRLEGDNYDFIREVRRRYAVLAHQVKRRFKFIKPESLRRVHRMNDGEELDLDGAIEAIIDRRAGHPNDDFVYSRRNKALRDVAAAFLLDMSASTDFPIPDPDAPPPAPEKESDDYPMHLFDTDPAVLKPSPPKRRVIDVARESLALMCEALATLGDSHAIYGFSGQGHDNVDFYVAKEFEDGLSARTWAALGAMKAQRSTRMGPAIRHALTKLERQSARMKVLIVVSDGYPQDFDYGPDRIDDEYGIQDTACALREAEEQGVQTFCVTIDPSGHDYLRRMCRENRYMVIDEVQDLPGELTKVYRALTV